MFLVDPTDSGAVIGWYSALTRLSPLWAMQFHAYNSSAELDFSRPAPLFEDLRFELMARPSRDTIVLRRFLRFKPPALVWRDGPNGWSFVSPPPTVARSRTLMRYAPRYLVQTYRFALMSETPGVQRLGSLFEKLREEQRWNDFPEHVPLRFLSPPSDYRSRPRNFTDELRELVIARDVLPRGEARNRANKRIIRYLKQTRILPDRGHKPSVPKAEAFVKRLGGEASSWLAVSEACLDAAVTGDASRNLAAWGCTDARESAWRFALPFLSQRELRYLLKNWATRELRMVYLVQARLRGILSLTVVADHLFGAAFVRGSRLGKNPLAP